MKRIVDEGEEDFISFCHCGQIYSVSKPKTYSDHCFDPFPKIETPNRLVGSKAAKDCPTL
jgi:hypothetical protein